MTTIERQRLDVLFMELYSQDWYHEPTNTTVNLSRRGWTMGYNNRKRSFGVCRYTQRRIELSKAFIDSGETFAKMEDTIRHEIAHALEYEIYGTRGHGIRWKRMCAITGADPSRTHATENAPKGRYELICESRAKVVGTMHRRPSCTYRCKDCNCPYRKLKVVDTKC